MQKIQTLFLTCLLILYISTLAVLEWICLGWYLITDFNPKSTIKRIQRNKLCPSSVLGLYIHYRLGRNSIE